MSAQHLADLTNAGSTVRTRPAALLQLNQRASPSTNLFLNAPIRNGFADAHDHVHAPDSISANEIFFHLSKSECPLQGLLRAPCSASAVRVEQARPETAHPCPLPSTTTFAQHAQRLAPQNFLFRARRSREDSANAPLVRIDRRPKRPEARGTSPRAPRRSQRGEAISGTSRFGPRQRRWPATHASTPTT